MTNPQLFEAFARIWLPGADLDRLAADGFTHLWLMGVWTLGTHGPELARRNAPLGRELDPLLPGWAPADLVGSPYAIARYAVSPSLGGEAALAGLRARLAKRGIALILDFVPNHTARDHDWIREAPELYVHEADGTIACGKDPYFPAWTDTAQLDHRLAATRAKLIETLLAIAERCDGVRCDMSMLVLPDVFEGTWAHLPPRGARATGEFWAAAIDAVRARHPDFLFIAEAYWDLEPRLQRLGFDFTYDKTLYDRLVHGDAEALRAHLAADLEYQERSVRFVENHDEPRFAAAVPAERRAAALVLAMTVPGMRFVHDGQIEGRAIRSSIHLDKRAPEPPDPASLALHAKLFALLQLPALRDGAFRTLALRTPAPILAHRWEHPRGSIIVAVNYSPAEAQTHVVIDLHGIDGRTVVLYDRMTGSDYPRDGAELVDPARGLHVVLAPWQAHVFDVVVR